MDETFHDEDEDPFERMTKRIREEAAQEQIEKRAELYRKQRREKIQGNIAVAIGATIAFLLVLFVSFIAYAGSAMLVGHAFDLATGQDLFSFGWSELFTAYWPAWAAVALFSLPKELDKLLSTLSQRSRE